MTAQQAAKQDFANYPPVPEGHTRVFLNHSWGAARGKLYGPGWAHVPDELLATIEASPDLVRTDLQGRALPDSLAASVNGSRVDTSSVAIPHLVRDDEGDVVEPDEQNTEPEEFDERSGGQTIGETGTHLDPSRVLTPQPGAHEIDPSHVAALAVEASRGGKGATSSASASSDDDAPKAATKSALNRVGVDDLRQLAADKGVKLKEDDDKPTIVDKLYNARVSLDD
jgi:hypothetical protein